MEQDLRTDAPAVMSNSPAYVSLRLPKGATTTERRAFNRLFAHLASLDPAVVGSGLDHGACTAAAELGDLHAQPVLAAAAHTLIDLVDQGWTVTIDESG